VNWLGLIIAALVFATPAWAEGPAKVVVLIFAQSGVDENAAVRVERDLRNMFDTAASEGKKVPTTMPIELRFDVGHISKGHLERSRRHFNDAQRALEKGDFDDAMDQLFRAERFYNKGIPFVQDRALLRGIFFYYYLARVGAKLEDQAREAYCAYVSLTRNLAGSAGQLEQFEPLADKCGPTRIAGTAELKVTANVDGAHVYVDNRPVGVIGRELPYVDPFLPAGPHLVEVRKAGFARWGTLVNIHKGKTLSERARLKKARNRKEDFDPLAGLIFEGEEAFSEAYISELLFQMAEQYRVGELVVGYLQSSPTGLRLTVFDFLDGAAERFDQAVVAGPDGHHDALKAFWKTRTGEAMDPADALPVADRFAPTLFKVE
jgi:hypothetical protein